jgi:uncharacterized membrane protein
VSIPDGTISNTLASIVVKATSVAAPQVSYSTNDFLRTGRLSGVSFQNNLIVNANPGSTIRLTHTIANTGNYTDTFLIAHQSALGWPVSHPGSVTIGHDQTVSLVISVTVPAGVLSDTLEALQLTATSLSAPSVSSSVTDTIQAGYVAGLQFSPGYLQASLPGHTMLFTHTITNTGNAAETFDITCSAAPGWQVACTQTLWLEVGETAVITITVIIPPDAALGSFSQVTLTAAARRAPATQASALDIIQVIPYQVYLPMILRLR